MQVIDSLELVDLGLAGPVGFYVCVDLLLFLACYIVALYIL